MYSPLEANYTLLETIGFFRGFSPPHTCITNLYPTLIEIRVLQGFFTNTYNKPYPIGFFTL
jgi:hypothetical protein